MGPHECLKSYIGPSGTSPTPLGCLNGLRLTKYDPLLCILPVRCFRIHGTPKGAFQKCSFGPKRAFWGLQRSLEGLWVPDLVPTAADWSNRIGFMVTTHFGLVLGFFWAPRDPKRARFGPKCPFLAPVGTKLKNVADPSCDLSKFARGGHLINEKNLTSIGLTS